MNIVIKICDIIGIVITVLVLYKGVFAAIGLFKVKHFKKTENKHKYAICVAARNERNVIKNLLESILNQDYPLDKLAVLVCPNNCTDDTADICREFAKEHPELQIYVYERQCDEERTKGYALRYLFDQVKNGFEGGVNAFEGYFIFDADNVLKQDYVTRMNEAFDSGNKIITSFRNSKNMHQNWISYGYAMHWMRTCLTENRAKAILDQACRVQGTGFLFSNELVQNGWNYLTLTEDRSFCTDAVIQNYKISYVEDAVFYDEQPYNLKVALRQRLRWSKGHLLSAVENCPKLMKNMFNPKKNFFIQYDCFWLNFPYSIESGARKIIKWSMQIAIAIVASNFVGWLKAFAISYLLGLASTWLSNIFVEILVLITYRKDISAIEKPKFWKSVFHVLMFPFFDIIGKWTSYIALFKKIEWKPIPHDTVVDISKLDDEPSNEEKAENDIQVEYVVEPVQEDLKGEENVETIEEDVNLIENEIKENVVEENIKQETNADNA